MKKREKRGRGLNKTHVINAVTRDARYRIRAATGIVFVPPPVSYSCRHRRSYRSLRRSCLRSWSSHISQFYIAIVVCFCHCCSTTVTPGGYGVDRVSVVARLAICYIAPLNGGTTYAIRATSTLNTPIRQRRIVVVATAVATGKCSSSAWGCWLWLHYRRLGCCRSLRSRRDDY